MSRTTSAAPTVDSGQLLRPCPAGPWRVVGYLSRSSQRSTGYRRPWS
jgi:hypothetical protein